MGVSWNFIFSVLLFGISLCIAARKRTFKSNSKYIKTFCNVHVSGFFNVSKISSKELFNIFMIN